MFGFSLGFCGGGSRLLLLKIEFVVSPHKRLNIDDLKPVIVFSEAHLVPTYQSDYKQVQVQVQVQVWYSGSKYGLINLQIQKSDTTSNRSLAK